jgi:hypothetical protein
MVRMHRSFRCSPRLFFQRVAEGKVVKNRLHLDMPIVTGVGANSAWRLLSDTQRKRSQVLPRSPKLYGVLGNVTVSAHLHSGRVELGGHV